jgi:hypothetical protein
MCLRKRITLERGGFLEGGIDSTPFEEGASMRKQNDSNPPTLKPDNRLINSNVRSRKYKRPNAQKHGLFARPLIIPGEDPREFDQILAELIAEWKPAGPTLRNALSDLAETNFRKRRLKKYVHTELNQYTLNSQHPGFDEEFGFGMFIVYLRTDPETCFAKHAKKCLRSDKIAQSAVDWYCRLLDSCLN